MANNQNLKPYTSENRPPKGSNSRKGIPNRRTLLEKWLKLKIETEHPTTGKTVKVSMHDDIVLSLIDEARKGNIRAIQEVQDSIFGKIVDRSEIDLGGGLSVDIQSAIAEIYGEKTDGEENESEVEDE